MRVTRQDILQRMSRLRDPGAQWDAHRGPCEETLWYFNANISTNNNSTTAVTYVQALQRQTVPLRVIT